MSIQSSFLPSTVAEDSITMNFSPEITTKLTQKINNVTNKIADKTNKINKKTSKLRLAQKGFTDPTQQVVDSNKLVTIDGDTYDSNGRRTRTLGIDTYETPKSPEWFDNPKNVERIKKQQAKLSQELGHPATIEDVYAAGLQQKKYSEDLMNQERPQLLVETHLNNVDKSKNYGRDLGLLEVLGGPYSKIDKQGNLTGEEGNSQQPILGNEQQALQDIEKYHAAKYPNQETESTSNVGSKELDALIAGGPQSDNNPGNFVDALQFAAGRTAAEVGDAFVDASTRLVKDTVYKGFNGLSEEEANIAMRKGLRYTKDLFDKNMNFIGADKYKTAKEYGYDNSASQQLMKNVGEAYDSGDMLKTAKTIVEGVFTKGGVEVLIESVPYMIATRNPLLFTLVTLGQSNESMGELQKNLDKKDIGYLNRTKAIVGNTVAMYLEKVGVDELIGNTKFVNSLVNKVIRSSDKLTAGTVVKALLKTVLKVVGKAGYEGLEEVAQQVVQSYTEKYGTKAEKELYDGTLGRELAQNFAGGFIAGTHISGGVEIVKSATNSGAKEKLDNKIKSIKEHQKENKVEKNLTAEQNKVREHLVNTVKEVQTASLKDLPKVIDKLDTINTTNDKHAQQAVVKIKQAIAHRLSTEKVDDSLTLGSEEETKAFIEETFVNAEDIENKTLFNNMATLAKRYNLTTDDVAIIKDRATVEKEATTGAKGYRTYSRTLTRLNKGPEANKEAIERVIANLEYFENTQIDRLDRIQKAVEAVEANLKSGTQRSKKVHVKYKKGGGWDIHIKDHKINKASYDVQEDIKRTIEGINNVYKEHGIEKNLDVESNPYSAQNKFRVPKKPAKGKYGTINLGKKLKKLVEDKQTIFMNIASNRNKFEWAITKRLHNLGYTEVDDKGNEKTGTGRFVDSQYVISTLAEKKAAEELKAKHIARIVKRLESGKKLLSADQKLYEQYKEEIDFELKTDAEKSAIKEVSDLNQELIDIEEEIAFEESMGATDEELNILTEKYKETQKTINDTLEKTETEKILKTSLAAGKESMQVIGKNKNNPVMKYAQPLDPKFILSIKKGISSLLASVTLEALGNKQLRKEAAVFTAKLKKVLAPVRDGISKYGNIPLENYNIVSAPARAIIFNKEGQINENVALAMSAALSEYISIGNVNLGSKTKKDVARILGVQESDVTEEAYEYFKNAGVYTKNAANDIGKHVLKMLGLVENKNIAEEVYAKLVADLGQSALLVGVADKELVFNDISLYLHNKHVFGETMADTTKASNSGKDKQVSFIKFSTLGGKKSTLEKHKNKFEQIQKATNIEDNFKKGPHIAPVVTNDKSIRNNVVVEQSPTAKKVLDHLRHTPFVKVDKTFNWLINNMDIAKEHLGYSSEEDLKNMAYNTRLSKIAVNEEIDRSLEAIDENELDIMYYDWFYSRNGRYMLDSTTINPQTDKLHRFLFIPKDHEVLLHKDNKEEMDLFKFALAQAFGMSTDKKPTTENIKFGELLLKKKPKDLLEMLDTHKFTDGIEVEHLSHYLQGIWAIEEYQKGNKTFTTNLSMESDAVTSGFGLKNLQFPILGDRTNVMNWLRKTGIFVNESVESMNDEVSKKDFDDSYETLAKDVKQENISKEYYETLTDGDKVWDWLNNTYDKFGFLKEFVKTLPKPTDTNEVSKELRTLFKDPFMTFNYSRGASSIKKGLGVIIANGLIDQMVSKNMNPEVAKLYFKLNKVYGPNLHEKLITTDPNRITANKKGPNLMKYLSNLGAYTYGYLATEQLNKEFGEFIELNELINETFKVMFIKYNEEYIKEEDAIEQKNNRGATKAEKLAIIKSLRNKFPLIKGPYSEGLQDSITINDSTTAVPEYDYEVAKTQLNSTFKKNLKGENQKGKTVNSRIRTLKAAIKAGSVIPIHYIDGSIMGNTILNYEGILGIHDAIIPPLTNTKEIVKTYNKEVIAINKQYSIIQELLVSAKRVFESPTEEEQKLLDNLIATNDLIQTERNWLFNQNIDVVHMSATPGSKYSYKPEETLGSEENSNPAIKPENLKKDALKSVEGMKNIINELNDINVSKPYKKYVLGLLDNIDPKFIPELNLYINKEADKNLGMINDTNIVINTSDRPLIKTNEMSATEVYAHEIMHAITKFAIKNAANNLEINTLVTKLQYLRDKAAEVITVQDLMPRQSLDKKKDLDIATKRWNYIFKNKTSLHEFIAHGLTNPQVIAKLKKIIVEESSTEKLSLFQRLSELAAHLLDIIMGKVKWSNIGETVHNSLMQLTFELMEYNNTAANEVQKEQELGVKFFKLLDKIGNKPLAKMIDMVLEKLKGDPGSLPKRPKKNATRLEMITYLAKYLPKLLLREDMKGFREIVFASFGIQPESFIPNVLRDIEDASALERVIEELGMMSDSIDRVRELTVDVTRSTIREQFDRKLTKTEEEAITLSAIDTDLSSIYKKYGAKKIVSMLTDKDARDKQIELVKTQLSRLDKSNFYWNSNQATGLGYYLATHTAGTVQNLNAHNIASGLLSDRRIEPDPKVVEKIDELATLVGIQYTSESSNEILANLIKEKDSAIEYIMNLNEGAKKEAKERIFETEVNIIKGYSKELFDDTIDIRVRPTSHEAEMRAQGFELVKVLKKDPADKSSKEMALYRSKMYVNQSYNRTATRMTDMVKKGTSLTDIAYKSNDMLAKRTAARDIRRIRKASHTIIKAMQKGEYTIDPLNKLSPILDQYGNITDYRYMMGKDNKKELLGQDTQVSEVLGRTIGSIQDKVDTDKQNEAVLDVILADMKENYIPGSSIGKNNQLYIRIEENSPNAKVSEIYKILPHHMRQAIKDSSNGYIAVRRDMLHNYFGFRDASITDFMGIHRITPDIIKRWIRVAEQLWQQVVSISKVDIIIRTPAVFIGNIISNFMYSVVNGASPIRVANMQLKNMRNVTKYINDQRKIEKLRISGLVGQKTQKEINMLTEELKLNPVHVLMEAGMYQAIVEDLDKQDYKSSNKLVRKINDKMEGLPEFIKQSANWLYLSERTGYFKFVTQATQYSDFIARATEYQLLLERGVKKDKALKSVLDAFVNYGKPASSFEEYLNNMGLFMFTKYMKRIQRAITKTVKNKPLNIILSVLGQEMFFDVDDIQQQSILVRSWANLDQDMFEHIKRMVTPSALQFVGVVND